MYRLVDWMFYFMIAGVMFMVGASCFSLGIVLARMFLTVVVQ